jgi:ABC-type sugar transport system ATPase subunit
MIRVTELCVRAGGFVLDEVSLAVEPREYGVLMGRTGCGKTTLLEAICGLKRIERGRIELDGVDVSRVKPAERGIGYVPQDLALFTQMSVREHLAFALELRKWDAAARARRVGEMAELLGIGHLLDRTPAGLSGGEQQRVALGRALSFRPRVLLLDEPLSALDDATRRQMYDLLKMVQQHEHVTALHVTHNVEEANRLGDRVFRFEDGRVVQRIQPRL